MLTIDQLIFVGLNGYAVALHRDTGDIVRSNNEMHDARLRLGRADLADVGEGEQRLDCRHAGRTSASLRVLGLTKEGSR
jgi:hypothetical protein